MTAPKKRRGRKPVSESIEGTGGTESTASAATKPPKAPRARARLRIPEPDELESEIHLEGPAKLTWPMQLELVRETSRIALRQCDQEEALAVGEFMLNVGVKVLELINNRPVMVIEKDTVLDRLITQIQQRAEDTSSSVQDVMEGLILKLDPVPDTSLN